MGEVLPRIAILASGSGSTAEAVIRATQNGVLAAEVGLVISNNPNAGVFKRVQDLNGEFEKLRIETAHISGLTHPKGKVGRGQTLEESEAISHLVSRRHITHVATLGYMKIIRGQLLDEYGWHSDYASPYIARMSNTHPGPLPGTADTFGIGASEKILQDGLAAAHTFHLVTAEVDGGPVLAAHPVEVLGTDTPEDLFNRIQGVEKAKLPGVLGDFLLRQEEYFRNV